MGSSGDSNNKNKKTNHIFFHRGRPSSTQTGKKQGEKKTGRRKKKRVEGVDYLEDKPLKKSAAEGLLLSVERLDSCPLEESCTSRRSKKEPPRGRPARRKKRAETHTHTHMEAKQSGREKSARGPRERTKKSDTGEREREGKRADAPPGLDRDSGVVTSAGSNTLGCIRRTGDALLPTRSGRRLQER